VISKIRAPDVSQDVDPTRFLGRPVARLIRAWAVQSTDAMTCSRHLLGMLGPALLVVGLLVNCASPSREALDAEESMLTGAGEGDLAFFDAHVHLNELAPQLASMDRHAIRKAVIFWGGDSDNASVLATARANPDRFVPFVSVSPERAEYRRLWQKEDPALLGILTKAIDAGNGAIKGIGEISAVHFPSPGLGETEFDPTGPIMRGIMDIAGQKKLPVMVHIELTRLREFAALLTEYRGVDVIWAHGGYTPLFLAARMLEEHPNLTYELSARTWVKHPRSPEYTILRDGKNVWPEWLELVEAHPTRFVVGTDASQRSATSDDAKAVSVHRFLAQLSPRARSQIASENLERLLKL
jgi:predicted TIM-barrel fold metal-dependent hydrolase